MWKAQKAIQSTIDSLGVGSILRVLSFKFLSFIYKKINKLSQGLLKTSSTFLNL